MVEYVKASEQDHLHLVDFLDYVFSKAYRPHDFETVLPNIYTARNFMAGSNYMVKEDGKIVANVGAYPADFKVCGESLKICSITAVAVHNRARSKGYMRKLMDMALEDMKKEGVALSFLLGQRQRYEYFGYTPCGVQLSYSCNKSNIRHLFGKDFNSKITLNELERSEDFDSIYQFYNTGPAYVERPRQRFADIMATWECKTIGVYQENTIIGYLSCYKDYSAICELSLADMTLLPEVIGVYLDQYKRHDVTVDAFPHETEIISQLSRFAETAKVGHALHFNIIDYPAVLDAFLKLKCKAAKLPDGALTVYIKDRCTIKIAVTGNQPSASIIDGVPAADNVSATTNVSHIDDASDIDNMLTEGQGAYIECTHTEAMQLFFSPVSTFNLGGLSGNTFARSLFPIPIFIKNLDRS